MLASFATMLGFPEGKLCYFQGFLLFFFARSSWLFTISLVFQLFSIIVFKKYYIIDSHIILIILPINILLQILPYTTGVTFGAQVSDDEGVAIGRCLLTPGSNFSQYRLWLNVAFRNVLLAAFIIIVILAVFILIYTRFFMLRSDPLQKLSKVGINL